MMLHIFQLLIGILQWIVEIGKFDVTCEVSMMASMMAMPLKVYLEQLHHIFSCLKRKYDLEIVIDPIVPVIDAKQFPKYDWIHVMYVSSHENIPRNVLPEVRGFGFTMIGFVDSDHAGDHVTCRSRTGFSIKLNDSPINLLSKKQSGTN